MSSSFPFPLDRGDRVVNLLCKYALMKNGVDGIGLADLMKEAGLSHGGFYRQFSSRDELVADAVEHALADDGQRLTDIGRRDRPLTLGTLIDAYLSPVFKRHEESINA